MELPVEQQIREIWQELNELRRDLTLPVHAPPTKVKEGMLRLADGTDWNPGAGRGLYQYISGTWVKL